MRKYLVSVRFLACLALTSCSLMVYADALPPANLAQQCQNYLMPDSQFSAYIENLSLTNLPLAQSTVSLLNSCVHYNVCQQLDSSTTENCSGTLATNAYIGNFAVENTTFNNANSYNSMAAPLPTPPQATPPQATPPQATQSAAPVEPVQNHPVVSPSNTTSSSPQDGSEKSNSSSIKWF